MRYTLAGNTQRKTLRNHSSRLATQRLVAPVERAARCSLPLSHLPSACLDITLSVLPSLPKGREWQSGPAKGSLPIGQFACVSTLPGCAAVLPCNAASSRRLPLPLVKVENSHWTFSIKVIKLLVNHLHM